MKVTRVQLKKGIYILPSLLTTGSVFCGFYAFIAAVQDKFFEAAVAILIAMVFDGLDGRVARFTKTSSVFGLQYDSLADVISFGMAPAVLVYMWVLKPFGRLGWMAAFLYLLCGALRLARFNVTKPDLRGNQFIGLPIPAAAGVLASIIIAFEDLFATRLDPMIMVGVVYLLAFLMVSNLRYPAFKQFELGRRVVFTRFLFVVLFLYAFATIPKIALFVLSCLYLVSGPASLLISFIRRHRDSVQVEINSK